MKHGWKKTPEFKKVLPKDTILQEMKWRGGEKEVISNVLL